MFLNADCFVKKVPFPADFCSLMTTHSLFEVPRKLQPESIPYPPFRCSRILYLHEATESRVSDDETQLTKSRCPMKV